MKKLILFFILIFTAGGASAQSVQLSTYYPSPFGMYDRIRLVPRAAAIGAPCDIGTLYVLAPDTLQFCTDDGGGNGTWGTFAGVWTQAGNNLYPSDIANPNLKVGIGTTTPELKLSLDNDGGILAKGTYGSGATLTTSGGNLAMMLWYPRKGAFRAGYNGPGTYWDDINIGDGSFASGVNNTASKQGSTAVGVNNTASEAYATAMGFNATASGTASIAAGRDIIASGHYAVALGDSATASGMQSISLGRFVTSNALYSFVLGNGFDGTNRLINNTVNSFMVGFMNSATDTSPELFVKDGAVGIGTDTPASRLEVNEANGAGVNGDIRSAVVNTNAGTSARALQTVSGAAASLSMIANGSSYAGGTWANNDVGLYSNQNSRLHIENAAINSGLDIDSSGKITIRAGQELTLIGKNSVSDKVVFVEKALAIKKDLWGGVGPTEIGGQGLLYVRSGAGPGDDVYFKNENGTEFNLSRGSIIETRTTNPVSPATGQMWLCTDTGDATPCNGI